jgi:hypothetical protein
MDDTEYLSSLLNEKYKEIQDLKNELSEYLLKINDLNNLKHKYLSYNK